MSYQPKPIRIKIRKTIKQRKINVLQLYGSLTSTSRALPEFIIVGSQRSGTTSLYNYLSRHPNIQPAITKEVHFFDYFFNKGMAWYRGHFPFRSGENGAGRMVTGEASPYYMFHPHAPSRIAKYFPSIKIIILLRNPVDRAFSHYQHEVSLGFESLSFEDAIEQESSRLKGEMEKMILDENYRSFNHQHYSYTSRGIYMDQVENWMNLFPRKQIQILNSEDFFAAPQETLCQVLRFLGLPDWNLTNFKAHNRLQYQGMKADTRERLDAYFEPFNTALYDYLGMDFGWNG